jgi:diphthamide biosynthesis enzyme Dph1/Dph2-like protein
VEQDIDLDECFKQIDKISKNEKQIIIIYQENFHNSMKTLEKKCKDSDKNWIFGHILEKVVDPTQKLPSNPEEIIFCGRKFPKSNIENCTFVFVGGESTTLTNWMMNFPKNKVLNIVRFDKIRHTLITLKRWRLGSNRPK